MPLSFWGWGHFVKDGLLYGVVEGDVGPFAMLCGWGLCFCGFCVWCGCWSRLVGRAALCFFCWGLSQLLGGRFGTRI